ncbi:MAG: heavy metal sensor histidine kinase [Azovibrio sp.]|uniref:heavy metal sensor histidine kinase n=1 Tax=Azovibrio sp. TaxID=1872673 RepID=UPI003C708196
MTLALRSSLTLRLALLFALLSSLILLGLGLFVGRAVDVHFQEGDLEELHGKLTLIRSILVALPADELLEALPARLGPALVGHPHLGLTVLDREGFPLFTSAAGIPEWLLHEPAAPGNEAHPPARTGADPGQHPQRGILAQAHTADGQAVQVAITVDIEHHRHFMAGFARSLGWALGLAVLANLLFAWIAARRGLAPLGQLLGLARRVSGERLHERLEAATLPLELRPLARELNQMLDRLEEAFARLSGFASDIAHELRTPVTALMTQTQVALSRARSAGEYREVLYSSLEEHERLSRMIGDMLFLAQAENGLMVPHREPVELAGLLQSLFEFYGLLAEEQGIRLELSGSATVSGDALMLRRALGNLLSNALRHTAPGALIRVTIEPDATGRTAIRVENPGPPIPAPQLERIFERFHRVDAARGRGGEGGAGLGLAITRSIITAHGGSIHAESAGGLTRFCITLPPMGP